MQHKNNSLINSITKKHRPIGTTAKKKKKKKIKIISFVPVKSQCLLTFKSTVNKSLTF
jgi:hypothetical protein